VDLDRPRESYALGVGVGVLLLDAEQRRRDAKGLPFDDQLAAVAQTLAARAVLAVMPAFDDMAKQADLDDSEDRVRAVSVTRGDRLVVGTSAIPDRPARPAKGNPQRALHRPGHRYRNVGDG
jgi:hypothetical protein